jgi:transposase
VIGVIAEAIGKLYAVEKHAEQKELVGQEAIATYTRLRIERSKPQLTIIHELLLPASDQDPKGTDQRKAIDFLIKNWPSFTICAEGGELPIDKRDFAIGSTLEGRSCL